MNRDFRVYLDDILESIDRIEEYTKKANKTKFARNVQLQDAILRRLEIIGEAAKHLPDEIKQKYPEIEWKKIAGARDIFAHEYFGVKLDRVWDTIIKDIPSLKKQIKSLLVETSES